MPEILSSKRNDAQQKENAKKKVSSDKKASIDNVSETSDKSDDSILSRLKSKSESTFNAKPISRTGPKPRAKKRISSGDYSGATKHNLAVLLSNSQSGLAQESNQPKEAPKSENKPSSSVNTAKSVKAQPAPVASKCHSNSLPRRRYSSAKISFYSRPTSPKEPLPKTARKNSLSFSSNSTLAKYFSFVEAPLKIPDISQQLVKCESLSLSHPSSSKVVTPVRQSFFEDHSFRGPSVDEKCPIVVITNCRDGEVGHYLALQFARQRCKVVCIAPHMELMTELTGSAFDKVAANLLDSRGADIIAAHLQQNYPRIDILMIPPSIDALGPVVEVGKYSSMGWRDPCDEDIAGLVYRANLLAPLCLAQRLTKLMMANKIKGTVSFVGSVLGDVATPWNALFSSSMAALHALADSLRLEVAPYQIKVLLLKMGYSKSMVVNNNLPTLHFPSSSAYKSVENHVFYRAVWNREEVESRAKIFSNVAVQTTLNRHLGVHYLVETILAPYKTVFGWGSRFASWMIPELESHLNFFSPDTNPNWPCTSWVYELGGEGIGSLHSYRNSTSKLFLDWFRWDWLGLGYVSRPTSRLITLPKDVDPRTNCCKRRSSDAVTVFADIQNVGEKE